MGDYKTRSVRLPRYTLVSMKFNRTCSPSLQRRQTEPVIKPEFSLASSAKSSTAQLSMLESLEELRGLEHLVGEPWFVALFLSKLKMQSASSQAIDLFENWKY